MNKYLFGYALVLDFDGFVGSVLVGVCWGTHWFWVLMVLWVFLVECVGYPLVLGFDGFVGFCCGMCMDTHWFWVLMVLWIFLVECVWIPTGFGF